MRRVKPAKSLESARFLLLKRRMQRHMPRHWARVVAGLSGLALAGVGLVALADRFDHGTRLERATLATSASLGFTIRNVELTGRERTPAEAVAAAAGIERGAPLLSVDPARARAALEALPWVLSATVERRLPDTLSIRLEERVPLALWQLNGKLALIDTEGKPVTDEHLERYAGLPLVVGEGAESHAKALIDLLASEPDLQKRVSAAVRVADRRWNLRMDGAIDVELPEEGTAEAWHHLAEIERNHALLARDVEMVDLRLPDRVVVRSVPEPAKPAAKPGRGKPGTKST